MHAGCRECQACKAACTHQQQERPLQETGHDIEHHRCNSDGYQQLHHAQFLADPRRSNDTALCGGGCVQHSGQHLIRVAVSASCGCLLCRAAMGTVRFGELCIAGTWCG